MIPIQGTPRRLCDGITRRDLLHIGGLGAFGLALGDVAGMTEAGAAAVAGNSKFGKAKACILIYKYGSPSQHETFDPKPNAPKEVRGVMKPISTAVPGIRICEGLPKIAKIMDRLTVVRSMVHPFPLHGTVYAMTGIPAVDTKIESLPRDKRQWPFIGSIVDYLEDQRSGGKQPAMPRNIAMPYILGSRTEVPPLAGPYGAFLGTRYDPVVTDFDKKGTRDAPKVTGRVFKNPYLSIKPTDKLQLSKAGQLPAEVPGGRFDLRQSLLRQFDQQRAWMERDERVDTYNRQKAMAASLLTSSKVRDALDVQKESQKMRDRYGMNLFGQSALAARRLVQAGTKFVTVFWDAFGLNAGSWDTHNNQFNRLTKMLLPGFDQGFTALILDLEARGMLDDTLVLVLSEHGRTPKINSAGGRDHWSRAYSQVYAGGGMGRGNLVGKTDAIAGDVIDNPISPKDVLATAFHLMGIDPDTTVPDATGRPMPITGTGRHRPELLG